MKQFFTQALAITDKELRGYFGSPMAAIFIGAFLLASLFCFFWIDGFFARNTADIRPFFRWLPLLLVFLVATLTMRQWSEEQKMGTMELLFTLPVSFARLVTGKFLAALCMVILALVLSLSLPLTVSQLGRLDWGPVFAGYLGGLLMAAAYISMGLFISSRTDNQIVALIITVLSGAFLYLLGASPITTLFGNTGGELLRAFSTSGRFASIERGVIDLRDLVYYLSLCLFFFTLTCLSLDRKRWSSSTQGFAYRRKTLLTALLVCANLVAINIWLYRVNQIRIDLTTEREFSISPVSRELLATLHEPLVLRGYFSDKTHPLLAPLVPHIKDLMTEYGLAGGERVQVEFVDPRFNEEAEAEATQQFGIQPVPFQVAGRYEASVVNSYFNILVKYGDQYEVLDFGDLVEVEQRGDGQPDVRLRNLEYDLTRTIKKTVYGFQSVGAVFEGIKEARLQAIISSKRLPKELGPVESSIKTAADELARESSGKLRLEMIDPDSAPGGPEAVEREYGVRPQLASLFSGDTIYLFLFLEVDGQRQQIHLDPAGSPADIRRQIEAGLKRLSSGFLKTVAIWTPGPSMDPQMMAMMGQQQPDQYRMLQEVLKQDYNVEKADLASGLLRPPADVLVLVAPQDMDDSQRVAVDQFLMQGGSLIVLGGSYQMDLSPASRSLQLKKTENGIGELLAHHGIQVDQSLVIDERNEPFPVPVDRQVGGFTVQEIQQLDYPYFVDVRPDSMAVDHPATASLPSVTMNWVSPLTMEKGAGDDRQSTVLLRSSPRSWRTDQAQAQPDFNRYPNRGFAQAGTYAPADLAVAVRGQFTSFYKDKADPRLEERKRREEEKKLAASQLKEKPADTAPSEPAPPPIIESSPGNTRMVVIGSSEFVNDTVLSLSRGLGGRSFLNSLGLVQNLVDWSVEDEELLRIRTRGGQARLLMPLSPGQQRFWEGLNYLLAFGGLLLITWYGSRRLRREKPMTLPDSH